MIRTKGCSDAYQALVGNGSHEILCDAPVEKGGGGCGLGAHDLLEASLALCMNMAIRMYAAANAIPLERVHTQVRLLRPAPDEVVFDCSLELDGALTPAQRLELERVAETCPVRQTLSRRLSFARSDP
jgi:putative redox protein